MKKILMIIGIIVMIVGVLLLVFSGYLNKQTIEITVVDKYVKNYKEGSLYIVAADNGVTYKISDLFFIFKFNSSDLYNKLEKGKKYKITTTGFRIHFLSSYQNINKIEEEK